MASRKLASVLIFDLTQDLSLYFLTKFSNDYVVSHNMASHFETLVDGASHFEELSDA
jgi:hypothetical protein